MESHACAHEIHPLSATDHTPSYRPPLWLLVLVTLSGTLAMHMFVPALGVAARELHTSPAAIQGAIGLYILGLALGQLVCGPISDKVGRRPTLMGGLALFTAASVCCALAPSVQVLLVARFIQALGGCTGMMLGRAMVRDTSNPEDTMRRLATLSLMVIAGPGLAPLVGGLIATHLGWRWIFAGFTGLGAVGAALVWGVLRETRPVALNPKPGAIRAEYLQLIRTPAFIGSVIGGGCSTTAFYAFIAVAPFVYVERLGQSLATVGLCLGTLMLGVSLGYAISARASRTVSTRALLLGANGFSLACAVALWLQLGMGQPSVVGVTATLFLYCVGGGICSPAVVTKAMSIVPGVAGSASGIFGCGQMAIGALCATLSGMGGDPGRTAALVMMVAASIGQVALRVATRRAR